MNDRELRQAVKSGAALLDLKRPGWARIINLEVLDVSECFYCCLGQVYGSYHLGIERILGKPDEWPEGGPEGLGYTVKLDTPAVVIGQFRRLTELWRQEVLTRCPARKAVQDAYH